MSHYQRPHSARNHTLLKSAAVGAAIWLGRELYARLHEADLRGQVAVVTGGSRGLGLLIARELASQGCKVAICARNQDELDRALHAIEALSADVMAVRCDVAERDQVQQMIAEITARFGRVDILVNNAGSIGVGPMTSMSRADFEHSLHVMYWGVLNPIMAVLPQMRERKNGRIVNITSIGGKVPVPHLLPYVGAKFAAVGLSEGLTSELAGEGIAVTTIIPGLMRTGSYLHAEFRGRQGYEAAWFSLADNIPGLAMNAEVAAQQIVRAIRRGETEVILSLPAKVLALFHALFPAATMSILTLVNDHLLPGSPGSETPVMSGMQVREQMGESPLSAFLSLGLKDAEKYLQMPGRGIGGSNGNGYSRN
jgi:short-subunit dehydrogenase